MNDDFDAKDESKHHHKTQAFRGIQQIKEVLIQEKNREVFEYHYIEVMNN